MTTSEILNSLISDKKLGKYNLLRILVPSTSLGSKSAANLIPAVKSWLGPDQIELNITLDDIQIDMATNIYQHYSQRVMNISDQSDELMFESIAGDKLGPMNSYTVDTGSLAQSLGTDKVGHAPHVLDVTVDTGSVAQSLGTDKVGHAPLSQAKLGSLEQSSISQAKLGSLEQSSIRSPEMGLEFSVNGTYTKGWVYNRMPRVDILTRPSGKLALFNVTRDDVNITRYAANTLRKYESIITEILIDDRNNIIMPIRRIPVLHIHIPEKGRTLSEKYLEYRFQLLEFGKTPAHIFIKQIQTPKIPTVSKNNVVIGIDFAVDEKEFISDARLAMIIKYISGLQILLGSL